VGIPYFQIIEFECENEGIVTKTISGFLSTFYCGGWFEGVNGKLRRHYSCELVFEEAGGKSVELNVVSTSPIVVNQGRIYTFVYVERYDGEGDCVCLLIDYFYDKAQTFETEILISEPAFFTEKNDE